MRNFKICTWFDEELQDERIFGLDFVKVVLHQILLPEHDLNGERCSRGSDPNTVTVKFLSQGRAAVSCSPVPYRFGGVGFGFWLTGKLGRAWHWCMGGAWYIHHSSVSYLEYSNIQHNV